MNGCGEVHGCRCANRKSSPESRLGFTLELLAAGTGKSNTYAAGNPEAQKHGRLLLKFEMSDGPGRHGTHPFAGILKRFRDHIL